MTLEQVYALVTILDFSGVVKDGMCVSEPILCQINNTWTDVFFTYGINYDDENYSGPVAVFGIDSEKKEVSFIKSSSEYHFPLSADDVVIPSDWDEEGACVYDAYAETYEKMRRKLLNGEKDDRSREVIRKYIDLLKEYTDGSFWCVYSILLRDLYEYLDWEV